MAYRASPEGVLAVVEAPRRELPRGGSLYLVAVGIEKPGNLGAMARSADAAGADALVVAEAEADPWNPNAIRASTGAVFTLPVVEASLDDVRGLGVQLVAAVVGRAGARTPTPTCTRPTAIVVGAEDKGLDERWREAADVAVSIPMAGRTADSLNTATAASVLLFEAVRQRALTATTSSAPATRSATASRARRCSRRARSARASSASSSSAPARSRRAARSTS